MGQASSLPVTAQPLGAISGFELSAGSWGLGAPLQAKSNKVASCKPTSPEQKGQRRSSSLLHPGQQRCGEAGSIASSTWQQNTM